MVNRIKAAAVMAFLALTVSSCAVSGRETVYASTTWHMDTYYSYTLYGKGGEAVYADLEDIVSDGENVFDCYSPDSEITSVNSAVGGEEIPISEELFRVLEASLNGYRVSEGAFDPTVGVLTELWGFGTEDPHVPSETELQEVLPCVDGSRIQLSVQDGNYSLTKGKGQKLDLGGIAKGYVLSLMKARLQESGLDSAVISAGGNVLLYGEREFTVGIRRPEKDALDPVCAFLLKDCVISTTGSYERFFVEDGVTYSHILDPRTGESVTGDGMASLSVICDDPTEADLLSTSYYVLGMERAVEAMKAGDITAVVLTSDGRILCSAVLAGHLKEDSLADGWELEVVGNE